MRPNRLVTLSIALLASTVLFSLLRLPARAARSTRPKSTIDRGFEVAPVPLNTQGLNKRLVGQGSYIVNVMAACNDCHTNPPYAPGGNPALGEPKQINVARYLAGGTEILPGIVSANITPDLQGLPNFHTYPEFLGQMRSGKNHHRPGDVLQVMPWPLYGQMTDIDLRSVYEYLRAIPPVDRGTPGGGRGR